MYVSELQQKNLYYNQKEICYYLLCINQKILKSY